MSETEITQRDAGRRFNRRAGESHLFRLVCEAYVLEVEDVRFHHNSAVMMPDTCEPRPSGTAERIHWEDDEFMSAERESHPDTYQRFVDEEFEPETTGENELTGGLGVIATAYRYAQENADYRLLLAGHTDTSGDDAVNFPLSELRAKNVLHLLLGEREPWVEICGQRSKTEDIQRILKHTARVFLWNCDPGEIDDQMGDRTRSAIRQFQESYNSHFNRSIGVDGVVGEETWGAIFDVYMAEVAELLETTPEELPDRRAFQFVADDQRYIACGEKKPIDQPERENFRSQENRRVELLFYPSAVVPQLECHAASKPFCMRECSREDCNVYGPGRYQYAPVEPDSGTACVTGGEYQDQFEITDGEHDFEQVYDPPTDEDYSSELEMTDVAGPAEDEADETWGFLDPFADRYPQAVPPQPDAIDEGDEAQA